MAKHTAGGWVWKPAWVCVGLLPMVQPNIRTDEAFASMQEMLCKLHHSIVCSGFPVLLMLHTGCTRPQGACAPGKSSCRGGSPARGEATAGLHTNTTQFGGGADP